jgi:hypothetical protein
MSDDLVERLRERAGQNDEYDWHGDIELEAADRIEKLEAALRFYAFHGGDIARKALEGKDD